MKRFLAMVFLFPWIVGLVPADSQAAVIGAIGLAPEVANEQLTEVVPKDGSEPICDRTCRSTGWQDTGDSRCSFSLACFWQLPPAQGYFIEQEKTITCTYTCDDGSSYVETYYRRRWVRRGCCGGPLPWNDPCPSSVSDSTVGYGFLIALQRTPTLNNGN